MSSRKLALVLVCVLFWPILIVPVLGTSPFMLLLFLPPRTDLYTDLDRYDEYLAELGESRTYMPELSEFPQATSVEVFYFEHRSMFTSRSIALIFTFAEADYPAIASMAASRRPLLAEPVVSSEFYAIPDVSFDAAGFSIRVVTDESFTYPKDFGMLGFDPDGSRICFLYYVDDDLDLIAESGDDLEREMVAFVLKYFRFEPD